MNSTIFYVDNQECNGYDMNEYMANNIMCSNKIYDNIYNDAYYLSRLVIVVGRINQSRK